MRLSTHDIRNAARGNTEEVLWASHALWAAARIVSMDAQARDDLAAYLRELGKPELGDGDREYIVEAVSELFEFGHLSGDVELDSWTEEAASREGGREAERSLRAETARFFARYQEAKRRRGLTTQREVAGACGLSPTTICAIETQSVKPQTRTLQKLAEGLGVSLDWLLGEDDEG